MVLENLVNTVLESNKLYREVKTQLPDIFEEIHHQVRQELVSLCHQDSHYQEWDKFLSQYPLNNLLKQSIYLQIDNLAAKVQKIPEITAKSPKKLRATTQLFNALLLCGRLKRPQKEKVDSQTYEDIWAESLTELWRFICLKIDKFDETKVANHAEDVSKFMIWINSSMFYILKRCYFKVIDNQTQKIRENYQIINIDNQESLDIPSPKQELQF